MNRTAILIAALMCLAGLGAVVARPDAKIARTAPDFSLEATIPKQFGVWREEPRRNIQVINPQAKEYIDKIYNQTLERIYVNREGYLIILSVAYGANQQGDLRAHVPESCYPGQGFTMHRKETEQITTSYGELPVRRLFMTKGPRTEPVTYWLKMGEKVDREWKRTLVELRHKLTGHVLEGIVFRVSSIDPDQIRANQVQDQFINQLLQAIPPEHRKRLSGLGES